VGIEAKYVWISLVGTDREICDEVTAASAKKTAISGRAAHNAARPKRL